MCNYGMVIIDLHLSNQLVLKCLKYITGMWGWGTYLVPMKKYCMCGNGLKNTTREGLSCLVSLEEGYKESETRITLSDTQSVPVCASCMTFELLRQIPQSLHRPLDCTDDNLVS